MDPAISTIRQKIRLARTRLDILLAASERNRRRRAADEFGGRELGSDNVVHAFESDGFAPWLLDVSAPEHLLAAWGEVLSARAASKESGVEASTGKPFFSESLSFDDLCSKPAFVNVALDEKLLRVVMKALGMVPHLESVEVVVSSPTSGPLSASQLWHRDVNDKRIVKLFVYLNDVGPDEGPFTYIPAAPSVNVPNNMQHYISDEDMTLYAREETWGTVIGAAGTAFLIDTGRCYHCGSRCAKQRVAYIGTYSSGLKFMKYSRTWAKILGDRVGSLSPLQRAVCGF